MKPNNRIEQQKKGTHRLFAIEKISLYSLILMSVVVSPLVTQGISKYFLPRQVPINISGSSDSSEESISAAENNLKPYLIYLLSTTSFGILTCALATRFLKDSNQHQLTPTNSNDPAFNSTDQNERVNDEISTLLVDMSHELRSPLNSILGFVQIMEQELLTTQKSENNIAVINRSGERLLSTINDVVDLAKIKTNRFVLECNNIDFQAWLDGIEQSFDFQTQSQGGEFYLIRQNNLPQGVCLDERRLRQILSNLIDYCFKFTMPTADISLKVTSYPVEQLEASQQSTQLNICFTVENSDCLVSVTELAALFDPTIAVRQEQKSTKGSSLNLPISHQLAQLMGGDLTVSNTGTAGIGISFKLVIQAEKIAAQKLPAPANLRRVIGLEPNQIEYRILIVDDSRTNRMIMSQLLEPVGFKVKEAVNGEEAIDVWLRWQPHMIWMDLKMPVMNGDEATKRIKAKAYPHLHTLIVALSATTAEEEKSLFKAAGGDDFVGKPFVESVIFNKIAQHLGIRYVYESIEPLNPNSYRLTADALNVMSSQWLNRVELAAIMLDRDLLNQLLQEIPPEYIELRNALQKQVDSFDFDKIISLAKNSKSN